MKITNPVAGVVHVFGRGGRHIMLWPQTNSVSAEDWAEVTKSDIVKIWLREGRLVAEDVDITSLQGFTPSEAAQIVTQTVNDPLLRSWLGIETRSKVRKAIEAQLKKIGPDRDEEDET